MNRNKNTIAVIGLGTMGAALALNLARHNFKVAVYNRTPSKTESLIQDHPNSNIEAFYSLKELVDSLEQPRKIILMVKAGKAVDETLEEIKQNIQAGDILIDGGNSHWQDTLKRQADFGQDGIFLIGCGISGGEDGALHGPSIMPGGDHSAVEIILPIFKQIAALDFQGQPCVSNLGSGAAGHFVKMLHNGIEYALMQGIVEIYGILLSANYSIPEILEVFNLLNQAELKSFLLDITIDILSTPDNLGEDYLINQIDGRAQAKGTGKWTVEAALELGVAVPNIANALFFRIMSAKNSSFTPNIVISTAEATSSFPSLVRLDTSKLAKALEAVFYTSYLQGIDLILAANREYTWGIDQYEVLRLWQGGCIIRSRMLESLIVDLQSNQSPNTDYFYDKLRSKERDLADLSSFLVSSKLDPVCLSVINSSLDYCRSMTSKLSISSLIQAQRDYFGAHTYQRIDRIGFFTGGWNRVK